MCFGTKPKTGSSYDAYNSGNSRAAQARYVIPFAFFALPASIFRERKAFLSTNQRLGKSEDSDIYPIYLCSIENLIFWDEWGVY